MTLSCIVLSSEKGMPSRISTFLEHARFFTVKAHFQHSAEAVAYHESEAVHYFIVDQQLANETLKLLQQLPEDQHPRLIILGAEETYFLENGSAEPTLFGAGTSFATLEKQLVAVGEKHLAFAGKVSVPRKVEDTFKLAALSDKPVWIMLQPGDWTLDTGKVNDALFVRTENGIKRLRRADLLLVEAERDYLVLTTADARYRILRSMKTIETKLDPTTHCRIHRSFIVQIASIHTIDQEYIWLDGLRTPVPIGPSYRKSLLQKLEII